MRIQHNIMALNAHRQLNSNNNAVGKSLEKLSSGFRINRAGDDAAGLAISEKMRAQIKGLEVAQANAQDGISLIQTAEGSLTEVHSMLNRMVELANKAANGTYAELNRENLQDEVTALLEEINRIADGTNFNGIELLNGRLGGYLGAASGDAVTNGTVDATGVTVSGGKLVDTNSFTFSISATGVASITGPATGVTFGLDATSSPASGTGIYKFVATAVAGTASHADFEKWNGVEVTINVKAVSGSVETGTFAVAADAKGNVGGGLTLQVGDTNDDFQKVTVSVGDMSAAGLGIDGIDISTQQGAADALQTIKDAIDTVSKNRSALGALQNRLDHTINNLGVTTENLTAAEARIRDVDMAKEMMDFTKMNVLTQAAQAMLAQANQQPQSVLQLLR